MEEKICKKCGKKFLIDLDCYVLNEKSLLKDDTSQELNLCLECLNEQRKYFKKI